MPIRIADPSVPRVAATFVAKYPQPLVRLGPAVFTHSGTQWVRRAEGWLSTRIRQWLAANELVYPAPTSQQPDRTKPINFTTESAIQGLLHTALALIPCVEDDTPTPCWISRPPAHLEGLDLAWVVPCLNGLVDARTGTLVSDPLPDLFAPMTMQTRWEPEAACPMFDQFCEEAFDEAGRLTFLRLMASFMLGDWTGQVVGYWQGKPGSGKTTMVNLMVKLFGHEQISGSSMDGLVEKFGLSPLVGTKVVVFDEIPGGEVGKRQAAIIKGLSSGARMGVRGMYKESQTVRLGCKPLMISNNLLMVEDDQDSFWSRLKWVNFRSEFRGKQGETADWAETAFRTEGAGIVRRLVRVAGEMWAERETTGRIQWTTGDGAKELERKAKLISDPLGVFLRDRCVRGQEFTVGKGELYGAYRGWADAEGVPVKSRVKFAQELSVVAYDVISWRATGSSNPEHWRGVGLKEKIGD